MIPGITRCGCSLEWPSSYSWNFQYGTLYTSGSNEKIMSEIVLSRFWHITSAWKIVQKWFCRVIKSKRKGTTITYVQYSTICSEEITNRAHRFLKCCGTWKFWVIWIDEFVSLKFAFLWARRIGQQTWNRKFVLTTYGCFGYIRIFVGRVTVRFGIAEVRLGQTHHIISFAKSTWLTEGAEKKWNLGYSTGKFRRVSCNFPLMGKSKKLNVNCMKRGWNTRSQSFGQESAEKSQLNESCWMRIAEQSQILVTSTKWPVLLHVYRMSSLSFQIFEALWSKSQPKARTMHNGARRCLLTKMVVLLAPAMNRLNGEACSQF